MDFDAAYAAWWPRVFGLARKFAGNAEDAEDLTQRTFLRAWRAYDPAAFASEQNLYNWLMRILANLWKDELRYRHRRPQIQWNAAPDAVIDFEESVRVALMDGLAVAPDVPHAVILGLLAREYTQSEMAATLGLPLGTLKTYSLRARAELRKRVA